MKQHYNIPKGLSTKPGETLPYGAYITRMPHSTQAVFEIRELNTQQTVFRISVGDLNKEEAEECITNIVEQLVVQEAFPTDILGVVHNLFHKEQEKKRIGFIVEGFRDEKKLLELFPVEVAVINARFTKRSKMNIEKVQAIVDDLYILTDPDKEGDRFAKQIEEQYGLERIELDPAQCIYQFGDGRLTYGVEYADEDYLRKLLTPYIS